MMKGKKGKNTESSGKDIRRKHGNWSNISRMHKTSFVFGRRRRILQLLAEMVTDYGQDMEDLLQIKDKNKTKKKIQEIKDRLISD